MNDELVTLLLAPLLLVPAMGILSRPGNGGLLAAELRRKALHVGIGLTALSFPLYLDTPARVLTAFALVISWMLAVRRVPALRNRFGACLFDTARRSHGELWFAVSIAFLLLAAGDALRYTIPVLVLALADSAAAIVGRIAAQRSPRLAGYAICNGKTLAGSAAFVLVAFFAAWPVCALAPAAGASGAALVALGIAFATGATELVCRRGTDNLAIPLVAWLILCALDWPPPAAEIAGLGPELLKLITGV